MILYQLINFWEILLSRFAKFQASLFNPGDVIYFAEYNAYNKKYKTLYDFRGFMGTFYHWLFPYFMVNMEYIIPRLGTYYICVFYDYQMKKKHALISDSQDLSCKQPWILYATVEHAGKCVSDLTIPFNEFKDYIPKVWNVYDLCYIFATFTKTQLPRNQWELKLMLDNNVYEELIYKETDIINNTWKTKVS